MSRRRKKTTETKTQVETTTTTTTTNKSSEQIEELKQKIEKLEEKIKKLESKIKDNATYKPYKLDFAGKEVHVININSNNKTILKSVDKISMTPNNIYVFELDKEYNGIQLNEPFDYVFEIVSFNGKKVKIKPRNSYTLMNNLPVFLVK